MFFWSISDFSELGCFFNLNFYQLLQFWAPKKLEYVQLYYNFC